MGYVAVKGGTKAIEASVEMYRNKSHYGEEMDVESVKVHMNQLINQVMSEASLYDRNLAALAVRQAEGNMEEAVFLLRAHRSTLPRLHYSTVTNTRDMFVERRVSASFKDIPGGQILGASPDFTHRLLDDSGVHDSGAVHEDADVPAYGYRLDALPKVVDYLEQEGLFKKQPEDDTIPDDITKQSIEFPSSRSERLQSLTRGQTGAVTSLGYAEIRGYGYSSHPNIGEVRVGQQPVHIDPFDDGDAYYIGDVELTEVEAFMPSDGAEEESEGGQEMTFKIGYGLTFGQNETKAIAMSVLDYSLSHPIEGVATCDDEFVLLHVDSVESTGFISHLKLPHYVTFQSVLDRVRQTKGEKSE
ncbi:carbon-phosphorus lyase complex subunit PhnI [Salinicoccus roseus]|uniref:Carbon-phosphorus lyase n=1 Tax=Salinicoccus roseus TaxID=45670 RepID=A0A0C2E2S4_9STAP|nr:carbon-phosphorus lyase complex subunit PhnI [Salinicoccus roseus]KIH69762.1 carbon-phosphorus lyase [Salinicoccus roseus]MDB0579212.1 carbon-phosphorus lyase complex subunit PhnI [Salinicoccus roseus]